MRKCIGCPLTAGTSLLAALPIVSNQAGKSSSLRQPERMETLFFFCVIFARLNTILEQKKKKKEANYPKQSSHVWKYSIWNGSVWETYEQMLKFTAWHEARVVAGSMWEKSHGERETEKEKQRKGKWSKGKDKLQGILQRRGVWLRSNEGGEKKHKWERKQVRDKDNRKLYRSIKRRCSWSPMTSYFMEKTKWPRAASMV